MASTYQVGNDVYDIDPAWNRILFGPLQLDLGGNYNPYGYEPVQVDPVIATEEGIVTPEDRIGQVNRDRGGGDGAQEKDPSNYSESGWWGGLNEDNVSMLDAAKLAFDLGVSKQALLSGSLALANPMMSALKSMKLDPMKDPTLQRELTSYLGEVAPDVTLDDFIDMYNTAIQGNWNGKLNAEDTIRGIAMGLNPTLSNAYNASIMENGMRPDQFAGWVDTMNQYNNTAATPLGVNQIETVGMANPAAFGGVTDTFDPKYSAAYNFAKTYGFFGDGMTDQQKEDIGRLNESRNRRAAFNEKVAGIAADYGDFGLASRLDNGMRSDFGSFGGIGGGDGANPGGVAGTGGSRGSFSSNGTSNAGSFGYGGGYQGGYDGKGGRSTDSEGNDRGGGDRASGGDRDGDSSNNGNGAHE